jgi:hypothetical protein
MKQLKGIESSNWCPTIHHLTMYGLDPEDSQLESWGWVRLLEVSKAIENIRLRKTSKRVWLSPIEIFENFGLLCAKRLDVALVTWVTHHDYTVDGDVSTWPRTLSAVDTYIPAGWSERILLAVDRGIFKIRTRPVIAHEQGLKLPYREGIWMPKPFNGPFVEHQLVGEMVNGEKIGISMRGSQASTDPKNGIDSITIFD